jgi:hypothetical protein
VDSESVERLGVDGHYEPYFDIEKESIQVNDTTIRTVERRFGRDGGGQRILTQAEEESKSPTGDEKVVEPRRMPTRQPSLVVKRVADTKISPDVREKTTVFWSDGEGMVQACRSAARKTAAITRLSQKSALLPDGGGYWQVNERRSARRWKERTTEGTFCGGRRRLR